MRGGHADTEASQRVRMDALFVRGERVASPYREEIVAQRAKHHYRGNGDEGIQDVASRLYVLAVFECDVKVCEEETTPEVGAPGERIPVIDNAEDVVPKALPGSLNLHDDNDAEKNEPAVLQLHRNRPKHTWEAVSINSTREEADVHTSAVVPSQLRGGIWDKIDQLQGFVQEPAKVGIDRCHWPG